MEQNGNQILDKRDFILIVNGREQPWFEPEINFAQVVSLAFGIFKQTAETFYTASYKHGVSKKPEGLMINGDVVQVKDKMIFNVTATNKS